MTNWIFKRWSLEPEECPWCGIKAILYGVWFTGLALNVPRWQPPGWGKVGLCFKCVCCQGGFQVDYPQPADTALKGRK